MSSATPTSDAPAPQAPAPEPNEAAAPVPPDAPDVAIGAFADAGESTNAADHEISEAAPEPGRVVDPEQLAARRRGRWILAGVAVLVALGVAVLFVLHNVRLTPSFVMLSLGWLSLVLALRFTFGMLERHQGGRGWWRGASPRQELEREKRALLKAIKEIEFDQQLGKMSVEDAAQLSAVYRHRAIEVLRALDQASARESSTRAQIEAELAARAELAAKTVAKAPRKVVPGKSKAPKARESRS